MPTFTPRRFDQILQDMVNAVVSRTELTDLNDGSVLLQILAASAREDDEQYVQMILLLDLFGFETATGDDLDDRARDLHPLVIARKAAVKAAGDVVFSRTGSAGAVAVPIGTIVGVPVAEGAETVTFRTVEAGVIPDGDTATQGIQVICETAGAVGNVAANTVTTILTAVAGVERVTNPAAFTTGADRETDDAFRDRIIQYLRSLARATKAAVKHGALEAEIAATGQRIVLAHVIEDPNTPGEFTLLVSNRISDFGGVGEQVAVAGEVIVDPATGGETRFRLVNWPVVEGSAFTLRQNGAVVPVANFGLVRSSGEIILDAALVAGDRLTADYTYHAGLMHEVAAIIEGDPADPVARPGYRAAGVIMHLRAPTPFHVSLAANVVVAAGFNTSTAFAGVVTAWTTYVNGIGIGEDVLIAELIDRAMDVPGVENILGVTIDGVAADAAIPEDGLAFTTSNLITLT